MINEINYYPLSASGWQPGDLEWIELYNRGGVAVDISGWSFVRGITFTFPEGTVIPGGGYLVACSNVDAFNVVWGGDNAVGNFADRLSNSADRISLVNRDGFLVDTVLYRDTIPWPERANGYGATCELVDPEGENDTPGRWAASLRTCGTPGYENSTACKRVVFVEPGAAWRMWRGTEAPPGEGLQWTESQYDDAGWEDADAPMGFGDDEFYFTHLEGMRDAFSTIFLRRQFEIGDLSAFSGFRLIADVDDGFIAYINGSVAVRFNMPETPAFDAEASAHHESGITTAWLLKPGLFSKGTNTIAVAAANEDVGGADFLIDVSLEGTRAPVSAEAPELLVNEVAYTGEGFWVELWNRSQAAVALAGYSLGFDAADLGRLPLSGTIEGGGYAFFVVDPAPSLTGQAVLSRDDDQQLVSSLKYTVSLGRAYGLWPDDTARRSVLKDVTPGSRNLTPTMPPVVITEFNYHPATDQDRDEFIELYNAGDADIELGGWRFTRGVSFSFPEGVILASHSYLLVVPDAAYAAELYPEALVIGNYGQHLDNSGEQIRLEDPTGVNVVDFTYADDGAWPRGADGPDEPSDDNDPYDPGGAGMTLELRDVRLDPSAGGAWVAETEGGTPGGARLNAGEPVPPVVYDFSFTPLFPEPGEVVRFTADIFCPEAIGAVTLRWRYEHDGEWHALALADDGMNSDGDAGDGTWGAFFSSLDREGTVLFYLQCESEAEAATFHPRNYQALPFMLRVSPDRFPDSESGDFLRIVMLDQDLDELRSRSTRSDRLLPCALLWNGTLQQGGKIRYRGSSARSYDPKSYRIELTHDQTMPRAKFIYLNGCHPYNQFMGMQTFRRAGITAPRAKLVSLAMEDGFWSQYVHIERMDEFFSDFHLTGDDGNLYRGERCGGYSSDLSYFGEDEADYHCGYDKQTNSAEADWADIVQLCRALNESPENYLEEVHKIIDVDQWCRYFAVHTVVSNQENSIYRQDGDDYFLYSRESDGRFILLPWDMDSVFMEPYERLFRPDLPAVRRFLTHPAFAPLYWHHLEELINRTFTEEAVRSDFHIAGGRLGGSFVNRFLTFREDRANFIRSQLSREISWCGIVTQDATPLEPLIPLNAQWRYFKGTEDPSEGIEWTTASFDDAAWETGAAGFGYGDNDDTTVFDDMRNEFTTVYIRSTFPLDAPGMLASYELFIDYDDAFVCYLNGVEILRGNVDSDNQVIHFDETADGSHEAGDAEWFDLAPFVDSALAGENTLAVVGLNVRASSSDFTLNPAVIPKDSSIHGDPGGCGSPLFVPEGAELALQGMAPVTETSFVEVGGIDAAYDCVSGAWEALFTGTIPETLTVRARNFAGDEVALGSISVVKRMPIPVSSEITDQRTLAAGQGPYLISNVIVRPDAVLTVEAGCELLTAPDGAFRVQGALHVTGTEEEPVVVRRAGEGTDPQVMVEGDGAVSLEHVVFVSQAGLHGTDADVSACLIESGELFVVNSRFTDFPFYCIQASGGTVRVESSVFEACGGGVLSQGADCELIECTFSDIGPRDAVRVRVGGGLNVTDSTFNTLERAGIDTTQQTSVAHSIFINAAGSALRFSGAGASSVYGTLAAQSGTGVSVAGVTTLMMDHVTLADNDCALELSSAGTAQAACTITNSIVWGNYVPFAFQGTTGLSLSYDLLQVGSYAGADGSIYEDPLFSDAYAGEYMLENGSPALRAALDGSDLGAFHKTTTTTPLPGDLNNDKMVNLADVVVLLSYLFAGGEPPWCLPLADANGDEGIDLSDAVYLLRFLFNNGDPPAEPVEPCS